MDWSGSTESDSPVVSFQAKYVIQLVVAGSQAVGRAFRQALKQEYQGKLSRGLASSHKLYWVKIEPGTHHSHMCRSFSCQYRMCTPRMLGCMSIFELTTWANSTHVQTMCTRLYFHPVGQGYRGGVLVEMARIKLHFV